MSLDALNMQAGGATESSSSVSSGGLLDKLATYLEGQVSHSVQTLNTNNTKVAEVQSNQELLKDFVNQNLGCKGLHCNVTV